jgi:methionine synthase I (cobalamin-dependent)
MLHKILELLKSEIVLFDGSMGARLMSMTGLRFSMPEELNLTNPDIIEEISMDYINAGARVVETNTFGASRNKLRDLALRTGRGI